MSQNGQTLYEEAYSYYTGTSDHPLNHRKALELFQQAATMGHSNAMIYLGSIYEEGIVISENLRTAVEWYAKAVQADSKNAFASYKLAYMKYYGRGTSADAAAAYKLAKASVDLCSEDTTSIYPKSCYLTGCILAEAYNNLKGAYPYFLDAAKCGNDSDAWNWLGYLSEQGVVPIKDPASSPVVAQLATAEGFYEKGAQLGNVAAMENLGRVYHILSMQYGLDMFDNCKYWYEKAVANGSESAKPKLKALLTYLKYR